MKTMYKKSFLLPLLLALAGIALAACSLIPGAEPPATVSAAQPTAEADGPVVSEGRLAPKDFKYLAFATPGKVAEVLVEKGDQVDAGQVLARLGSREQAEAARTAAKLEQVSAQQAYDELVRTAGLSRAESWQSLTAASDALVAAQRAWAEIDTDDFQKRIDDALTTINERKDNLDDANEAFEKHTDLSEDNTTRQNAENQLEQAQKDYDEAVRARKTLLNQRDQAKAGLEQAQAALDEAQRKYDLTQDGPDPDQLALAQARLENANAQVQAAQVALDNLELTAPFAGTVVDIAVTENEQVGVESWAILIADFSAWYVETTDLTELDIVKVSIGQQVTMTADALPDAPISGQVTEVSDMFSERAGDITYTVRILLDEPLAPRLRWGMTVEVNFPSS